ncbi:TetR family transcriptional regulator [Lichenihabitans psoromatis]|uniref:TetR family transcriptional regulator n=1 Tax=Lichenihabitans psoromatis TaxID=2528642 RepID=UPI001038476B|nr:TetR family transcriptional regulator [Lichenihabitans psoromatis]
MTETSSCAAADDLWTNPSSDRARILKVARQLVAANGTITETREEIAALAGVTAAAVSFEFKDRGTLLAVERQTRDMTTATRPYPQRRRKP